MGTTLISKNEKNVLANMTELTPENEEIIKRLFRQEVSTRQIYLNLPKEMRRNPQVIELCMKYTKQNKLAMELIIEQTGMDRMELLKMANRLYPDWVVQYLKNNRIEISNLIDLATINPEIFNMLRSCKVYTQEEKDQVYATSPRWVKEGKPVQYMKLSQNVQFEGRSDYLKFVQAYISEDTSLGKFCGKYQIDRGPFYKVLELVSSEDRALEEQIEQTKERASQRYMAFMADIVDKVISGETSIEEVLNISGGRINGWDFLNCKSFISAEKAEQIVLKMVSEIEPKARNFKRDDLDVKYNLPRPKVSMEELSKWFDQGKGQPIEDIYNALGIIRGRVEFTSRGKNVQQKAIAYNLERDAKVQGGDVIQSKIIGSFFEPDKKTRLTITDKTLQDALTIIKANKKIPSHKLAILLSKDILFGKIPQSEIDEAYRVTKTEELQEKGKVEKRERKMAKLRTVDEYIAYINTPQIEQENEQQQEDGVQE